ncbi:MAG: prepilin-type N-terminal cleavage/methylation domain-containing protein [Gammaproteobacteria bacterium]|nr:prepilin-type N-terminal cleavage/methylation domain-containing protein [Gammaproteobacteria bacterium]
MIIVKNKYFSGFSLIELVVVVLLLGILSVFAMGRMFDQNQFAAKGFFDDTVTAVRFAQKLAVSTGCEVQVSITSISYQLSQSSSCTAGDFTNLVSNPANRANDYSNSDMPSGYSLSSATIVFNALGVPSSGVDTVVTFSGGSTPLNFTVYGQTGLVDV